MDINDAIERSVPVDQIVNISDADVHNVDFIGYRRSMVGDIFGTLPPGTSPTYIELRHEKSVIPSLIVINIYHVYSGTT